MTLDKSLRLIRDRWILVLSAILVGLLAAGVTWSLVPREYSASTTLYVSSQTSDNSLSAYQGAQLSEARIASYLQLATSPRVTAPTVQALNLPMTPGELAKQVKASSATGSVLIDIAVSDPNPQTATLIANTIASNLRQLVNDLERPNNSGSPAPITVRIVQPATVPAAPSSLGFVASMALGLVAGLFVGVSSAVIAAALDKTIKTSQQLQGLTETPTLGSIGFDTDVRTMPLTVRDQPNSPRAEAFRQIRTNLQFLDVDSPHKVLMITSSLPSEGKTTSLANLALAHASAGERVLAIEGDLRKPMLSQLFGLDRSIGLTSILTGRIDFPRAVQSWAGGLDILASGPLPPNPSELLSSGQMKILIDRLRSSYDLILIDTPPLLPVTDAAAASSTSDGVLLFARYGSTTEDQVRSAMQALRNVGAPVLGTVLSFSRGRATNSADSYGQYYASESPVNMKNTDPKALQRSIGWDRS